MLAFVLLLGGLGLATPTPAAAASAEGCQNGYLSIVAHMDDDLYFQNPDILKLIRSEECFRTVYTSAGDSGYSETYWSKREGGAEASYAWMAGVPNQWTTDRFVTGSGQSIMVRTLSAKPNISLVYMRLPDGEPEGTGTELYGWESLSRLLEGDIPVINAIDDSAAYTSATLRNALIDLINAAQPDHILTMDYINGIGEDSDNYDHHATALYVQDASRYASRGHTLTGYMGYPNEELPQNIFGQDMEDKTTAYNMYQWVALPYEPLWHPPFMYRQYTVDSRTLSGPVANAGTDRTVAVGTTVTLDASLSRLGVNPVSYSWKQISGPVTELTGADTAKPTFTAPVEGSYAFEVTVSDGIVKVTDTVMVVATPGVGSGQGNVALTAKATASSQNVDTAQTAAKAIDGVISGFPGDYTKEWASMNGRAGTWLDLAWTSPVTINEVTLYDRPNMNDQITGGELQFADGTTVEVPALDNSGGPTRVTFPTKTTTSLRFTVTGVASTTQNAGLAEIAASATGAPVADAGPDQKTGLGSQVTLDGTASRAAGSSSTLTYQWEQTAGDAVTLSDAASAEPTYTPTHPGRYEFQLAITDGGRTAVDTVVVDTEKNAMLAGVTATASSQNSAAGQTAAKAVDGVVSGYPADATKEWATNGGGAGSWLNLAWPSAVTIDEVVLYDRINGGDHITSGTLRFSDGSTVKVPSLHNRGGATSVKFPAKTTTSLRFTVDSVASTTGHVGLAEITPLGAGPAINHAPVAEAGSDLVVQPGQLVTLDATRSSDLDPGTTLTYTWVQTDGPSVALTDTSTAKPSFNPTVEDDYSFRLTVSDGELTHSDTVAVTAAKSNVARQASATASSQNTSTGQTAAKAIDGFIDGYPGDYTKEWVTVNGKAGSWLNLTWSSPVTIDEIRFFDRVNLGDQVMSGTLTFSDGSSVSVPYLNNEGRPVFVDVNGNIHAGPTVVKFPAKRVTSMRFTITSVSSTTGAVGLAEIMVLAASPGENNPPVVNAGLSTLANAGDTVTLDGSGTTDPDGTNLTYQWTQIAGPPVSLASPTAAKASFKPTEAGTYTFRLAASDGKLTAVDTVTVDVFPAESKNVAGTATATASSQASGQTAAKAIDGVIDGFPGDYTREWATNGGKTGSWLNLAWASPVTINKVVLYDRPNAGDHVMGGTLRFSDGTTVPVPALDNAGGPVTVTFPDKTTSSLRFTVTSVSGITGNVGLAEIAAVSAAPNRAPVAQAGPDASVEAGGTVTLDGSGSSDPDGDSLTYQWTQTGGPSVSLATPTAAKASFTSTAAGSYTFRLTVSDGQTTATDDVTIQVSATNDPNVARTATVTASSENTVTGQTAVKAVDGVVDGFPGDYSKEWATKGGRSGSWLKLAWASPVTINQVVLHDRPNPNDQVTGGRLTFSDGSTVEVPALDNAGGPVTVAFPEKTTSSVVFTVTSVSGSTGSVGLAEIAVLDPDLSGAPVAQAGPDASVEAGGAVTLDGSGSSSQSGGSLAYQWVQTGGPKVTLASPTSAKATFTPNVSGTYTFRLVVSDGEVAAADDVQVTVTGGSAGNVARTATVTASSENTVTGQTAVKAVDGVVDGFPGDYSKEWATKGGRSGSWLKLAWASPVTINQVVLHDRPNPNDQVTGGRLTFSDGSTVEVPALDNAGGPVTVAFPEKTTSSVVFTVTSVSGSTGSVGLAEITASTES